MLLVDIPCRQVTGNEGERCNTGLQLDSNRDVLVHG